MKLLKNALFIVATVIMTTLWMVGASMVFQVGMQRHDKIIALIGALLLIIMPLVDLMLWIMWFDMTPRKPLRPSPNRGIYSQEMELYATYNGERV